MIVIYPIVEGHGDTQAVPELIRRVSGEICGRHDVHVLHPHRVPRGRMVAQDSRELKRAIDLGILKIRQTGNPGAIMILLDADNDCPARLAPELLARISRPDVALRVVVAKQEYEAWFLAGARSLRRHRSVSPTADAPPNPESIRGAKEYLRDRILRPGFTYRETVDQKSLTAIVALEEARLAPSFDKFCRDVCSLLRA